jgi:hypothetical protein
MPREYIRDPAGKVIAVIEDNGVGGRVEVRDPAGQRLGYFDRRANQTRDTAGRLLARGNILLKLIGKL